MRKTNIDMADEKVYELAHRVFADLLDWREPNSAGRAIVGRVKHLPLDAQAHVYAQTLGLVTLTLEQVRERSITGTEVLTEIRDGITQAIVLGTFTRMETE